VIRRTAKRQLVISFPLSRTSSLSIFWFPLRYLGPCSGLTFWLHFSDVPLPVNASPARLASPAPPHIPHCMLLINLRLHFSGIVPLRLVCLRVFEASNSLLAPTSGYLPFLFVLCSGSRFQTSVNGDLRSTLMREAVGFRLHFSSFLPLICVQGSLAPLVTRRG